MRAANLLDDFSGVEQGDHVCWAYDDEAVFDEAAARFLAEGRDRGERLIWVGDGGERLRAGGGPLGAVDELTSRGDLRLLPLAEAYAADGPFSPEEQLAFYDGATRQALDDGYTGLRAVAEVTDLVRDPRSREEFLRWEQLADEYVSHGTGLVVFCAYRRADLTDDVLADVTALHPLVFAPGALPPFRAWSEDGRLVIEGDVDTFAADRLLRVLRARPADRPALTLDLSRLAFIDLAGCRAVALWARETAAAGTRLEILGAPRLFQRMWELLDLTELAGVTLRG